MTAVSDQKVVIFDGLRPNWEDICENEPMIGYIHSLSIKDGMRTPEGSFKSAAEYEYLMNMLKMYIGWRRSRDLGGPEWMFSNRAFDIAHARILG